MKRKGLNKNATQRVNLAAKQAGQTTKPGMAASIAPKSISRTRQDIQAWNQALNQMRLAEKPKAYPLQLLYNEIVIDALLKSQLENRINKSLSKSFVITDANKKHNTELTGLLQNAEWVYDINLAILNSRFYGHSVIELGYVNGKLKTSLLPRTNIDAVNGLLYPDYADDKTINYRAMAEYGTWVLEFGEPGELGLLNTCVPHVLMKRFATSCWSELCEIYGIPPRVMKTNTHDAGMVRRGEKMLKDMGAASWFIIDTSEEFAFAQGVSTKGDVYKNLIQVCNREISMVIQGAILGQDTQHGGRSKEEASSNILSDLVDSDLSLIEQYWNTNIIPALINLGILPPGVRFAYDKPQDLDGLYTMTIETLEHYDVDPAWIKEKFGIPVQQKQQPAAVTGLKLNLDSYFI